MGLDFGGGEAIQRVLSFVFSKSTELFENKA
uniref:Uncharacterized protein n=1 Tax=Rhizophora mucronata TaxID=61149 RepID=A0A2P2KFJ9_RHIMU